MFTSSRARPRNGADRGLPALPSPLRCLSYERHASHDWASLTTRHPYTITLT